MDNNDKRLLSRREFAAAAAFTIIPRHVLPVTEALLLGCLGQRLPGEKFLWDTAAMKITNNEKANQFVDPSYRNGYD